MKIRIFKEDLNFDNFFLLKDDENYHYLLNVLKIRAGERVILFSRISEAEFVVEEITKKLINFKFIKEFKNVENSDLINNLAFILPIIKSDKLNLIGRQIVEIGFGHIFLVKTNFSQEVEKNYKESKFLTSIKEALEQSGGFHFPTIHNPVKLDKIINSLKDFTILYGDFSSNAIKFVDFFNNMNINNKVQNLKQDLKNKGKIAVLIGPEGGLSATETQFLEKSNCFGINIGERKQRCETASVCLMIIAKNLLQSTSI